MSDTNISRRNFVQALGLAGGAAAVLGPAHFLRRHGQGHPEAAVISALLPEGQEALRHFVEAALAGPFQNLAGELSDSPAKDIPAQSAGLVKLGSKEATLLIESRGLPSMASPDFSITRAGAALEDPRADESGEVTHLSALFEQWRREDRPAVCALNLRLVRGVSEDADGEPAVVVESMGREIARLPLGRGRRRIMAPGRLGDALVIVDHEVRITKAPCRHKICQEMGAAERPGDSLVCAPNGLLVRITGRNAVDSVTG